MNKRGKITLFLVIGVLVLLGLFYVRGDLSSASIASTGDGYNVNLWSLANAVTTYNITIAHDGVGDYITNFTIDIDSNNFTTWTWYDYAFGGGNEPGDNETEPKLNVTFDSTGSAVNWSCFNSTANAIICFNESVRGLGDENTSIILQINATANNSAFEQAPLWNITTSTALEDFTNNTNVTSYIDGDAPRFTSINITDGNTTYTNCSNLAGEGCIGPGALLDTSSDITVTMTLSEAAALTAQFYYVCNASGANVSEASKIFYENSTPTFTPASFTDNFGQAYLLTDTISQACLEESNWTQFTISARDKFGHTAFLNDTANGDETLFTFNTTSTVIRVANVNVSDGNYVETRPSVLADSYLRARNLTFTVELLGEERDNESAVLHYNTSIVSTSTGMTRTLNDGFSLEEARLTMANLTETFEVVPATTSLHEISLDLTGNDTHILEFWVTANNTAGTANYATIAGPFVVYIDGSAPPKPAITAPSDTSISTRGSITYSCASTDALSGTGSWEWTLTKPNGDTVTKASSVASTTNSQTFTDTDTNFAGTYTVVCKALDQLAQKSDASDSKTFSVTYSSVTTAGEEGAAPAYDVDFSQEVEGVTVTEGTISGKEGLIKTFSFDGVTEHKITFKEITETSATLEIQSEPVTVTLEIGETKEADLNADGINDLSVTLNSITDGTAEITVKKIEEGVAALGEVPPTEEVTPTEEVPEEEVITPEAKPSMTWLWITIIVIAAVVIIGIYLKKRKKK